VKFILIILIPVFAFSYHQLKAQEVVADTLNIKELKVRKHSPTKATLMSAVIPGLGQAYNKKYWKVPIVWATIGVSLQFAFLNNKSYQGFKTAYLIRIDDNPDTVDEFKELLTDENLKLNMEFRQRNRDLSIIFAGIFYVFNIVDAAVDAHLFNFPKTDNLSFNIQPSMQLTRNNQVSSGISLVIKL
jgi:Family of unknown function (DUF5683)